MPDGKKTSMTTKELKSHVAFAPATQNLKFFCFEWPPPSHLFVNVHVGINYISHFIQHLYGGHFFFSRQCLDFFRGVMVLCFPVSLIFCLSASLLLCFSAFLLHCFSVFCFPCFSAFPASQFFVFPASLLFLLLCFSASLFSPLLCFLASYFYFPCVFHFPSLDSILSVS